MDETLENGSKPGHSRAKAIILLAAGLLLVAGVVGFVLVLVNHDSGPGASDPVGLAKKYIRALEEEDIELYVDCYDPEVTISGATPLHYIRPGLEEGQTLLKEDIRNIFDDLDIEFKDDKAAIVYRKGDYARVMIKTGSLSIAAPDGGFTRDLKKKPCLLNMHCRDGRWYVDDDVTRILLFRMSSTRDQKAP